MFKVLLVDDSSIDITIIEDVLETYIPYNKRITSFTDSAKAKSYYLANDFDLIVTDIEMPEVDGFELIDCIKNNGKQPVIAISGSHAEDNATDTILYAANKCGADYVVSKATLYDDLASLLTNICHQNCVVKVN
ncbi:response regulator [Thalassotalea fusca]